MKIELKKWTLQDKEPLMKLYNTVDRSYLSDRIPSPYTHADVEYWLNMVAEHDETDGIYRAVTVDGEIVGNISVEQKEDIYRKDAEISYLMQTNLQSAGIMTEAVKEICKTAFEKLDIIRMTGMVYEPNISSRKVLEKNGFVLEGIMKNAIIKNENIYNLCIYGKQNSNK